MRRLDLITVALTLSLSAAMEGLFYFAFLIFGSANQPNLLSQIFGYFHYLGASLSNCFLTAGNGVLWQDISWGFLTVSVALLEWWLIILAAIWLVRRFARKSV